MPKWRILESGAAGRVLAQALAAAIVMGGGAALAQTTTPQPPNQQGSAGPPPSANTEPSALQEVVVTAQKREQKLQDVPVSISVVSSQLIAETHATDLRDIQSYIPNLAILDSGVDPVVYIRGFGSGPNNVGFDQEVSIYSDGIYGGRSAQFAAPFFDVARVEVLRGPQGALFGKNTAAGAISIVSAGPTNHFEAGGTLSYGAVQTGFEGSGYVSGPLTDTLSARLAVQFQDQDGFLKNNASGDDDPHTAEQLARLTLHWQPNAKFDVTAKLEYARLQVDGGENLSGSLTQRTDFGGTRYVAYPYGVAPYQENNGLTSKNLAVNANYNFGPVTLTSVTGYSTYNSHRLAAYDQTDPDGTVSLADGNDRFSNAFPESFEQYSEELRLANATGSKLEYTVGLYTDYSTFSLHQDAYYDGVVFGLLTGHQSSEFDQIARTYSVFAQGLYHVTDRFRAIASVRYSDVNKKGAFSSQTESGVGLNPIGPNLLGNIDESYIDPSGTLQYDVARRVMAYATIARGSKSGGFVSNTFGETQDGFQFRPERSTNYEVGAKSTLFNGRMTANAAVFYMKFDDLQQSAFDPNTQTFLTRNAAEASSKGVELDLTWLPMDSLQLNAGLAYLDASYDNFPGAQCLASEPVTQCDPNNPASVAANNIKGAALEFAPKWNGNVGARYTRSLPNDLRMVATGNVQFRSKYFVSDDYSPIYGVQDGWAKLDLRVQVGPSSDRWSVAVYARNLTDEHTVADAIAFPAVITGVGRSINWMDQYRQVGVEASFKFR